MVKQLHPDRFVFLDGLRFIAGITVATHHSWVVTNPASYLTKFNSGMSVDFFFILSGFVLATAYGARLDAGFSPVEFMTRRLKRLYPLILLGMLMGAIAHVLTGQNATGETALMLVKAMFFVPTMHNGMIFQINVPMWSLFFEVFACGAYVLLVRFLPRTWLKWIAVALTLILAWGIAYAGQIGTLGPSGDNIPSFLAGFPRSLSDFLLGVMLQRSGLAKRLPAVSGWVLILVLMTIMSLPQSTPPAIQILVVSIILPCLIAAGSKVTIKATRTWDLMGQAAYPLYAIHFPILMVVDHLAKERLSTGLIEALGVGLAIILGWAAFKLYDQPVRARLALSSSKPRTKA
jgi:peptidoglycan/LPS O-acetylase OafA/YrhL